MHRYVCVATLIFALIAGSFTAVLAQEEPPPDDGNGEVEVAATGEPGTVHVDDCEGDVCGEGGVGAERELDNMNWNGWNAFGWTPVKRRHAGNDNWVGRARVWVSRSAADSGWQFSVWVCEDVRWNPDRCMHSGQFNPDYRANWWTFEGHPRSIGCNNPNGKQKYNNYSRMLVREPLGAGSYDYKPPVAESNNITSPLRCRSTPGN